MEQVKILLVEDSAELRASVKRILAKLEFDSVIYEAENSKEAVYHINEKQPVVTILDLNLNGENGINLIPIIKDLSDSKIIVLTNESSPAIRKKCLTVGADYFLDKSMEFSKLPSTISNLRSKINFVS